MRTLHSLARQALAAALLSLAASAARAQAPVHLHPATHTPDATARLLPGLGEHHYAVSTRVPLAQRFFDQGLRLTYAFNHGEAVRAFQEAQRLDPACAMCAWGEALALGPNINLPMDSASGAQAYTAARRALALAPNASPREQALIRALALRYAAVPAAERAALDTAYARAMADVVHAFPGDPEAATLYAEALMDLSPWSYWEADGRPRPATPEILRTLEGVLARNPQHPGACHYYIHAVEAAQPQKAVACAERLASLMPAAGHLVHMPAHIYIRVGRWNDAIQANHHAVHADEQYLADRRPGGFYPLGYYPHNYHFLGFAATMAGRSEEALEAARATSQKIPPEAAARAVDLELFVPYHHLALVSFGRWGEVLRQPLPPRELRFASAMTHYARGVALAALRRPHEAGTALDSVRAIAAATPEGIARTVLDIASHALRGEIAGRGGRLQDGIAAFREAVRLEDGLMYMEPPYWYYPIRHSLGALLLQAGQPAEAEALYRQDLARFPENGWSLFGLPRFAAVYEVEVTGERFRLALQTPAQIAAAEAMLRGERESVIHGALARGDGGFNPPYRWHLRPETVTFPDVAMEVCSGRPRSDVEADVDLWADQLQVYCPWGARVLGRVGQ